MLLLVHGEVTDPEVDFFDREKVFIETKLKPLLDKVRSCGLGLGQRVATRVLAKAPPGVAAWRTAGGQLRALTPAAAFCPFLFRCRSCGWSWSTSPPGTRQSLWRPRRPPWRRRSRRSTCCSTATRSSWAACAPTPSACPS